MLPRFITETVLRWASWAWNKWSEFTKTVGYVDRKIANAGFNVNEPQKLSLIEQSREQVKLGQSMTGSIGHQTQDVVVYNPPNTGQQNNRYDVIVTTVGPDGVQQAMPITISSSQGLTPNELYDSAIEMLSQDAVNRDKYGIKDNYTVIPNKFYVLRVY